MEANDTISMFNGGKVKDYHVFSEGKYLGTLDKVWVSIYIAEKTGIQTKNYNKAFIYHHAARGSQPSWWRADATPYPKEQIPKDYLAMCLLVA